MGAVTSKEGYNFQGKKFCKEIFHFFQNDGLPTHFQANSPSPFDVESVWDILNIWFSKVSTQNNHWLPQYIFQRIGSTAQKGSDWGGSKGYSL